MVRCKLLTKNIIMNIKHYKGTVIKTITIKLTTNVYKHDNNSLKDVCQICWPILYA